MPRGAREATRDPRARVKESKVKEVNETLPIHAKGQPAAIARQELPSAGEIATEKNISY
jgi:hypothetical protein